LKNARASPSSNGEAFCVEQSFPAAYVGLANAKKDAMRPEIETVIDQIREAVSLLRRHL
jgi:hypothetical protein